MSKIKIAEVGLYRFIFTCLAIIVIIATLGLGLGLSFGLGADNKNTQVEALQNENRVLPRGVTQVSEGSYHTMAIDAQGNLWAFGYGSFGQLGNMSTLSSSTPINITAQLDNPLNGKQIIQVSAGGSHTLAIDSQGNLWAFGQNFSGELGNMSTSGNNPNSTPINITAQPDNPLNGKQIIQVSTGSSHTMAIDSQGNLWAFGNGGRGRLGNMSTLTNSNSTPINITAQEGNPLNGKQIVQVSAGSDYSTTDAHTLAIDSQGNLWAFGRNNNGQLGNMSTIDSSTPINLSATHDATINPSGVGNPLNGKQIVQVSAGGTHTMAIDSQGNLWAFGTSDALGSMSTTDRGTPINITAQPDNPLNGKQIVSVSAATGGTHTMAIDSQGNLWAFGGNVYGQLGNMSTAATNTTPKNITAQAGNPLNGKQIVQVSAGYFHTTAIDSQGNLWAFGYNYNGQLGNMTTATSSSTPINISAQAGNPLNQSQFGRMQLSAGGEHTMAIDSQGSLWAFGSNYAGQLGKMSTNETDGAQINITAQSGNPLNGKQITQVSAGNNHTMAIDSQGNLWAFGYNYWGQLGNMTTDNISTPINITAQESNPLYGKQIIQVSAGGFHTMAIDSSGNLWAFGYAYVGQLGNMVDTSSSTPINITAQESNPLYGKQIIQVSAGYDHTMVIDAQGNLWAFGYNYHGQLGNMATDNINRTPINITAQSGNPLNGKQITQVSAGSWHTMAIDSSGGLWAFGNNGYGQLGNMNNNEMSTPEKITEDLANPLYGKQIVQVSAGSQHTVAIDAQGNLWTFGYNSTGQLGDMSTEYTIIIPINITAQSGNSLNGKQIIQVSAGYDHTMAIDSQGNLWAFGYNNRGQLGNLTTSGYISNSTPINIFLQLPRVKINLLYSGQSAIGSTMQLEDGIVSKSLSLDFEVNERPIMDNPYLLDKPIIITFTSKASFSKITIEGVGYVNASFDSSWFLINYDGTNYTMELEIYELDWDNYILTVETDMILQVQHIYNPPAGEVSATHPDILNLTSADGTGWADAALANPGAVYGTFLGWYTHPTAGTKITDISQFQQTMDATGAPIVFLYAHWA